MKEFFTSMQQPIPFNHDWTHVQTTRVRLFHRCVKDSRVMQKNLCQSWHFQEKNCTTCHIILTFLENLHKQNTFKNVLYTYYHLCTEIIWSYILSFSLVCTWTRRIEAFPEAVGSRPHEAWRHHRLTTVPSRRNVLTSELSLNMLLLVVIEVRHGGATMSKFWEHEGFSIHLEHVALVESLFPRNLVTFVTRTDRREWEKQRARWLTARYRKEASLTKSCFQLQTRLCLCNCEDISPPLILPTGVNSSLTYDK